MKFPFSAFAKLLPICLFFFFSTVLVAQDWELPQISNSPDEELSLTPSSPQLGNQAQIAQVGVLNNAIINQTTNSGQLGNQAVVLQKGSGNTTELDQSGGGNYIGLVQDGQNNQADIIQNGQDQQVYVIQRGDGNSIVQDLSGDEESNFIFEQQGVDNIIEQNGSAPANGIQVKQSGVGLRLIIKHDN